MTDADARPLTSGLQQPCPFCGAPNDTQRMGDKLESDAFRVYCAGCGARGPWCGTEDLALAAWNRRTLPAAKPSPAAVELLADAERAEMVAARPMRVEERGYVVELSADDFALLHSVAARCCTALAPSAPARAEIRPPTADQVEYVEKLQRWREESERDLSSRVIGGPRQPAPTESAPAGLDAVRAKIDGWRREAQAQGDPAESVLEAVMDALDRHRAAESAPAGLDAVREEVERRLRAHEPALGVGRKVAEWNARQEERRWFLSLLDRHRAAGDTTGLDWDKEIADWTKIADAQRAAQDAALYDLADMPDWNPSTGTRGTRSVSEGRVFWHAENQTPWCAEHGAMLCVSESRCIWRCEACGAGAYRAAGAPAGEQGGEGR